MRSPQDPPDECQPSYHKTSGSPTRSHYQQEHFVAQLPTPPSSQTASTPTHIRNIAQALERTNTARRITTSIRMQGAEEETPTKKKPRGGDGDSIRGRASISPEPELIMPILPISPRDTPELESEPESSDLNRFEEYMSSREGSPLREAGKGAARSPSPELWNRMSRECSPEVTVQKPLREISGNVRPKASSESLSSSTMSFDMVNSYQALSPADKRLRQRNPSGVAYNQRAPGGVASGFNPNSGLSKPITPSFIRDYPKVVRAQVDSSGSTAPTIKGNVSHSMHSSGHLSSKSRPPAIEPPILEELNEDEKMRRFLEFNQAVESGASDPTIDESEGMREYFERLDKDRFRMGWTYAPLPPRHSSHQLSAHSLSLSEEKQTVPSQIRKEVTKQVNWARRVLIQPAVTLTLVSALASVLYILYWQACLFVSGLSPEPATNASTPNRHPYGPPDFPSLMTIQSHFERVVDSSVSGSELARSIKYGEMAVSDLAVLVRHSQLNVKEELAPRLETFAKDSRDNVGSLIHFSAEVGAALESLLQINRIAYRSLQEIAAMSDDRSVDSGFFYSNPLTFWLLGVRQGPSKHERLVSIFDDAAETLESNLRLLINSGTTIASCLDELALQHRPIHELIVREIRNSQRDQAMSSLWGRLWRGHNSKYEKNEQLLSEISLYQDKARGYVEVALMELRRMTSELDTLRRRVAEPILVRGLAEEHQSIDIKMQIESVKRVLDSLEMKREKRDEMAKRWRQIVQSGDLRDKELPSTRAR